MGVEDTVLYKDVEKQLSEENRTAVRSLRIITQYGTNITAGTVAEVLKEEGNNKAANGVADAAFMYDSQYAGVMFNG